MLTSIEVPERSISKQHVPGHEVGVKRFKPCFVEPVNVLTPLPHGMGLCLDKRPVSNMRELVRLRQHVIRQAKHLSKEIWFNLRSSTFIVLKSIKLGLPFLHLTLRLIHIAAERNMVLLQDSRHAAGDVLEGG